MNFLYVKKENTALNQTDISLDLRKFSKLEEAIKFCNSVKSFTGVYVNVTEGSFYAYALFSDTSADKLYIANTAKHYVLIKDLRFYREQPGTVIVSSQEDINKLMVDGSIVECPVNAIKANSKVNISVLSAVQEEANCIFILYKCESEEDRLTMNWSKAKLDTIIYTMSPVVDVETFLEQKLISEGKYIVRQIYFIDVEEADYEFLSLLRLCNVITYVNNVAVKKSWIPDIKENTFVYHYFNVQLKKGVHSIMNDFSFDTKELRYTSVDENGNKDVFRLNTAQVFRKKGDAAYLPIVDVLFKQNPLLATTFVNSENKYFIDNCTGANKSGIATNDVCKDIMSKDYFSEESRLEFKKIFIDYEVDDKHKDYLTYHPGLKVPETLIKFLYTADGADIDSMNFAKERVESYFVNMFYNMEKATAEDIAHIRMLLPILSKYGEVSKQLSKDILYINFLEDCYDDKGDKNLCREVEFAIRSTGDKESIEKITTVIDKSDYLFCTKYDVASHTYGFENDKLRCEKTVLSNSELTNYFLSSKCTDDNGRWKGGEYCISRSINPLNMENKQRKLYYQQLFTSKDKLINLVEGGEVESLAEFINYSANEFLAGETAYDNIDFLVSEPMIELCSGAEGSDKYFDLCDGVHSSVKYIQPGDNDADNKKISEAQRLISIIEKNRNLVTTGKKCLEGNTISQECKYIFNTEDSTDLVLYSGEIFKFCKRNPFSADCSKYYSDIDKYTKKVESLDNKKESNHWYYVFILIIVISITVTFLKWKSASSLQSSFSEKQQQQQPPLA